MTKDELLKIYSSPAYRVAKYDYIWKNDGNGLTTFWNNYETRRTKELQDALNKDISEREKEELKKEQEETTQNALLEKYMTAKSSLANSKIAYDSAVAQHGANSSQAKTAKNTLANDQWLVAHIGKQLGMEPSETLSSETPSSETPSSETPSSETPSSEDKPKEEPKGKSTSEITLAVNQLVRDFDEGKDVSLDAIAKLEKESNIDDKDKDKLSKLRTKIKDKKTAAQRAKETKAKIDNALKDLDNPENRRFLRDHGYKISVSEEGNFIATKIKK